MFSKTSENTACFMRIKLFLFTVAIQLITNGLYKAPLNIQYLEDLWDGFSFHAPSWKFEDGDAIFLCRGRCSRVIKEIMFWHL